VVGVVGAVDASGASTKTDGQDLARAVLNDQQRVALLLAAAALLAHLEDAGWHLPNGFAGARVVQGSLTGLVAAPGSRGAGVQALLCRFLEELFGDGAVVGRGSGRRAARRLRALWTQNLLPIPATRAVEQIFATAPFLWQPAFAAARRCLVVRWRKGEVAGWGIVGAMRFQRRLRSAGGDCAGAEGLLAEEAERVAAWWAGEDSTASAPHRPGQRLQRAQRRYDQGRFEDALEGLRTVRTPEARVLRAACQNQLGRLGAAARTLKALEPHLEGMDPALQVAATEVALRVLPNRSRGASAADQRRWLARVEALGQRVGGATALYGGLLAATAAWDRGDGAALAEHLEKTTAARDDPDLAWRWHHAAALAAMARGEGPTVVEQLSIALQQHRRRCRPFEAAALWNDLGIGRAQQGELAGAERAFRHTHRLLARCQGPRATTLALYNCAEIRLRRGRLAGVRETLERTTVENRRSGNLRAGVQDAELWARYEMVLGRYRAALSHLREAQERLEGAAGPWRLATLRVLAARALGCLGLSAEAAAELALLDGADRAAAVAELEAEERPALWALAGHREEALESAANTPLAPLWLAVLTGREAPTTVWAALEFLEPYRRARLVLDAERLHPGVTPARWRRAAGDTLRRVGAPLLAQSLEARDHGPWRAVARYSAGEARGVAAVATLVADAGYPEASLEWRPAPERQEASRWLFGQPSPRTPESPESPESLEFLEQTPPGGDGMWRLHVRTVDSVVEALFALVVRDLEPPQTPKAAPPAVAARHGMVGESPELQAALDRLRRLAAGEMPLLIHGESGTGKELAAQGAHEASPRAGGPFVPINCAALSETLLTSDLFGHVRGAFTGADRDRAGVFETARGGTVFLDEIGDLPLVAQGMLLRVLQEGEIRRLGESLPRAIDARLITATHRDLAAMVEEGTFRQDLFYRLKVAAVTLPPLRLRGDDVVLLADHFLRGAGNGSGARLSPVARQSLLNHAWPGNVRELKNVLSVAAALTEDGVIDSQHLEIPTVAETAPTGNYTQQVNSLRLRLLREAMAATGGNRSAAGRRLGLSRQAMTYLIRELGVEE
jgi:two-component system NtrC family response regulator